MKLFSVHIDRDHLDGGPGDGPPITGKIDRLIYRYAAESIEQVWDHHRTILMDGHDTIHAIVEDSPAVEVLSPSGRGDV